MMSATTILLVVIIVAIVAGTAILVKSITAAAKRQQRLNQTITTSIQELFESEGRELAKAYAEERQLIQWIEELSTKGELNVKQLASSANQRAYAMAVKKAEHAVTTAESSLSRCRETIFGTQSKLFIAIADRHTKLAADHKLALKELVAQEKYLKEQLESARADLSRLERVTTE